MKFLSQPGLLLTTNSLCTVLKKTHDPAGFLIAHPYYPGMLF